MSAWKSDFLRIVSERGFVHQGTDLQGLDQHLEQNSPAVAYCGFDATADSLHVGSLLPIMLLRWYQKCGHRPIVLMGGGTTKIGDPSGKDESRQLISADTIQANIDGIRQIFDRLLDFDDPKTGALLIDNRDWLDQLNYIDLLRDVGPHFTVNRMMSFESVKRRLEREQPLTFLEFNYMILQAFDFVTLNQKYGCTVQLGGSDQWGNIVAGIELNRRLRAAKKQNALDIYGLTTPLLTTATGAKMGKSADGAIWLNEDRLPSWDFFQYWRNVDDADVIRFLKLFTELPLAEIDKLARLEGADINQAKKILAHEVTRLCRGDDAAEKAAKAAHQTFEAGQTAAGLPTHDLPRAQLETGVPVIELLTLAGFAKSNGEARRLIKGGGARLNDETIRDDGLCADIANLNGDSLKISAGKKRHALIRAV